MLRPGFLWPETSYAHLAVNTSLFAPSSSSTKCHPLCWCSGGKQCNSPIWIRYSCGIVQRCLAIFYHKISRDSFWFVSDCIDHDLNSLNNNASYRKISLSLKAVRLDIIMIASLWNSTGLSAFLPPMCLLIGKKMGKVDTWISWLGDLTIFCGKTSVRPVNRGLGSIH